ncbi:MAG: hypothetical protein JST81_01065 [Bacteroidetes bacterium]|nr:hypothetical protein [Bacteroidota bacterium]
MKHTFLYKLYTTSRYWFVTILLFIAVYLLFFTKKMDAALFPYNNMFAIDFTGNYSAKAYLLKIDGTPVVTTSYLYWKKDFLEETLANYARYKKDNDNVYMSYYLENTFHDGKLRQLLTEKLTPEKAAMASWLKWYAGFTGATFHSKSILEVYEYSLECSSNQMIIKDSSVVFKTSAW